MCSLTEKIIIPDQQTTTQKQREESIARDLVQKVLVDAKKRVELELSSPKEESLNTSGNTDDEIILHKEVKSFMKTVISNAKSRVEMSLLQDSLSSQSLSNPMQSNKEDTVSDEITSTNKQSEEIVVKDLVEKVITNAKKRVELELPSPREENLNPSGNTDYEATMCKEVKSLLKTVISNAKSRVEMSLLQDSLSSQSLSDPMQSNKEDTVSDEITSTNKQSEEIVAKDLVEKVIINAKKRVELELSSQMEENLNTSGNTNDEAVMCKEVKSLVKTVISNAKSRVEMCLLQDFNKTLPSQSHTNPMQEDTLSDEITSTNKQNEEIVAKDLVEKVITNAKKRVELELSSQKEENLSNTDDEAVMHKEAKSLVKTVIFNAKSRVEMSLLEDSNKTQSLSNPMQSNEEDTLSDKKLEFELSMPKEEIKCMPVSESFLFSEEIEDDGITINGENLLLSLPGMPTSTHELNDSNVAYAFVNYDTNESSASEDQNLSQVSSYSFSFYSPSIASSSLASTVPEMIEESSSSEIESYQEMTIIKDSISLTQSGYENALREEAKALTNQAITNAKKRVESSMLLDQDQYLTPSSNGYLNNQFNMSVSSNMTEQTGNILPFIVDDVSNEACGVAVQDIAKSKEKKVSGTLVPEDQCFVPSQFTKNEKSLKPSTILSAVYSYPNNKWLNSYSELDDSFQIQNTELSMPSTILSAVHSYPIKNSFFDKEDSFHKDFNDTKNCIPSTISYPISMDKNPSYSSIEKGSFNPSTPEYDRTSLELKETQIISESEFARVPISEYESIVTAGDKIGLSGALPESVAEVNSKTSLLQNLNVRSETSPFQIQLKKGFFSAGIKLGLNEMDMLTITSISSTNIIGLGGNLRYVDVMIKHSSQKIFPLF